MDTVKNMVKGGNKPDSQFEQGHKPPVSHQDPPGRESDLPVEPVHSKLPTEDEGFQAYKAAGKLQGKNALITGGDSGIGRAIAILFAMEGAVSMIAYLLHEEKDAQETKRKVEEFGGKCYLYPTDLTSQQNCQKLVDTAIDKMGSVNILVNNAAYQMVRKDISELDYDQWHRTFDTNIHPFFYLSKKVIPQMKRGDTIINNASINAYVGRPDLLDYTSTKGAIVSFTRGLANQQVRKGIRVNSVAPGPVWSPLIPSTMDDDAQKQFSSPMGRPGQPSEIATCFVFLASQDSSLISGQTLHPNGGVVVNG